MCRPWKPGVSCPGAVVWTVTVAKPPVNSNVGGGDRGAVGQFELGGELLAAAGPGRLRRLRPRRALADGAGEPVQTDGVVPGWVATGSLGLHALSDRNDERRGGEQTKRAELEHAQEPSR